MCSSSLSYSTQAKAIAIIEIVASITCFLIIGIVSMVLAISPEVRRDILHKDSNNFFNLILHFPIAEKISAILLPAFYLAGELGLAILLFKSVDERNYKRCRLWYIVTITLCMVGLYFFIPGVFFTEDSYYFIGIFVVSYIFTSYSLWVVYSFMKELKAEGLHQPMTQWDDDLDKL